MAKVAYDIHLKRPGCVLIAAGLGASTEAAKLFPVKSWLVELTPGMAVYETTKEQLDHLIKMAEATYGNL